MIKLPTTEEVDKLTTGEMADVMRELAATSWVNGHSNIAALFARVSMLLEDVEREKRGEP